MLKDCLVIDIWIGYGWVALMKKLPHFRLLRGEMKNIIHATKLFKTGTLGGLLSTVFLHYP